MTLRSVTTKSISYMITSVVALSVYAQPARAGIFGFLKTTGVRDAGTALEINTDIKIGEETVPRTIRIPMLKPKMRYLFSPHTLRAEFLRLAEMRRGDAYAAKRLLDFERKYPDLKLYLDQYPSLRNNAEALQAYAVKNDQAVESLKLMQLNDGGKDIPGALNPFRVEEASSKLAFDAQYPGFDVVLQKHPDLKEIFDKNPSLLKPHNNMSEQLVMTLYKLPIESLSFFAAQGAVYYLQLQTDIATNPMLLQQHIDSQKDPVTAFSFMALLAVNGMSVDPLMQKYGYKDAVRRTLPYMGLTLGLFASNVATDMGTLFKNSGSCRDEMTAKNGQMGPKCQELSDEWNKLSPVEIFKDSAPGLLSMIAATAVSSAVDMVTHPLAGMAARKIGSTAGMQLLKRTTGKVIISGFAKVGLALSTDGLGGAALDAGMFALSFLQNTQFTFFMSCIDYSVSSAWRNITDTINFESHDSALNYLVRSPRIYDGAQSKSAFEKSLAEIKDFGHDMQVWRKSNLGPITGADTNWQIKLHEMMNGYVLSHSVYADFLDKLGAQRSGGNSEAISIDFSSPLVGISPNHGWEGNPTNELFTESARNIVPAQKQTAKEVGDVLVKQFAYADKEPDDKSSYMPQHWLHVMLLKDGRDLQSGDVKRIGNAVRDLMQHSSILFDMQMLSPTVAMNDDQQLAALKKLGLTRDSVALQAAGSWARGQSFVYGWDVSIQNTLGNGHELARVKIAGVPVQPRSAAEYMLVSMAMGPDARNQPLIKDELGWISKFIPPRLTPAGPIQFLAKDIDVDRGLRGAPNALYRPLFNTQVSYNGKVYTEGLMQVLREENFIPGSYDRANTNKFEVYWDTYVGKQYEQAWVDYENKYQVIVQGLIDSLFTNSKADDTTYGFRWGSWHFDSKTRSNNGPIGNGQVTSMNQEFQTYLLMLGTVTEPGRQLPVIKQLAGYTVKEQMALPRMILGAAEKAVGTIIPGSEILANMGLNSVDKSTDVAAGSLLYPLRDSKAVAWSTQWQKDIMAAYVDIESFAHGLRVVRTKDSSGRDIQVPLALNSGRLDDKLNALTAQMKKYQASADQLLAKDGQRRALADQLFAQMGMVTSELRTLLLTANAISWRATQDGTAMPMSCNDIQKDAPNAGVGAQNRAAAKKNECQRAQFQWRKPKAGIKDVTGHNDSAGIISQMDLTPN